MDDVDGMMCALTEAARAMEAGEVPVGAAVYYQGELIATAGNEREKTQDPTAHAEIVALRKAAKVLGRRRLQGCTMYVTLEPCPMCSGALLMSRLGRCVFGAADPDAGCCGSVYDLPADPLLHGNTVWEHGVLEAECKALLNRFFNRKRQEGGAE